MSLMVPIALFGYIPVVFLMFAMLPARRAVLTAYICGWLLLPMAAYPIAGLPEFSKVTVTSIATLLSVLVFDSRSLAGCKPRLYDVPVLVWMMTPMLSSLSNDLGAYDGLSGMFNQAMLWGIPYLLGRAYFRDADSMRELAVAVFVGGMIYVPLCLIEIRMSPQLHKWIYGFGQHHFLQSKRFGGYRPVVFLQHGLAVGLWMTAASISGFWLWWTGALKKLWGLPSSWLLCVLLPTSVLVKSLGAIILLAVGITSLAVTRWTGTRLVLVALMIAPLGYVAARTLGGWEGRELVDLAHSVGGSERASSLAFRMNAENLLVDRAKDRPVLGWGGWGRNRNVEGRRDVVTDGFWIIVFGQKGVVGLVAAMGVITVGAFMVFAKMRGRMWKEAGYAGMVAMSVVMVLYLIDNLFNAMANPVFVLAMGGLPAAACQVRRRQTIAGHQRTGGDGFRPGLPRASARLSITR